MIVAAFGQICDEGNWREISHHRIARQDSRPRDHTGKRPEVNAFTRRRKGQPDFRTPSSASASLSRCPEPFTQVIVSATPSRGLGVPDRVPGGTNIPARPESVTKPYFGGTALHRRIPFRDAALDGRTVRLRLRPDNSRQYRAFDAQDPWNREGKERNQLWARFIRTAYRYDLAHLNRNC